MPRTPSNTLVQTASTPNARTIFPQSDISIVPFPPDNPSMAFISTSFIVPRRPTSSQIYSIPQGFEQQAKLAFSNLETALALGGAKPRDVTKLTVSLAQDCKKQETTIQLRDAMTRFFTDSRGRRHSPAVAVFNHQYIHDGFAKIQVQAEAVVRVSAPEPELDPGQDGGELARLPTYDEIW
ncbi:hypothetical protein ASPVEDRAFT_651331 [Aspergillus versicolor CBS 583.65]|uniref:Uncharacterized protein n=1 Tax=Aspergillus versicolor CBS 583.65 TaxID=1036611 RepID=A0A1L9PJU5_ASPVE|nr:uncharacterized protein ASPVEDRAFT_651331 [Aspergillus versicolor CBS 583.65]OJJ01799.1 hypothetical protein ASPVEDRAFT_651331 [Aspergillus versicolor CBS 583.65]